MRTVDQAFTELLSRLVPLQSQRDAATSHRSSVLTSLKRSLDVSHSFESGSFSHGTGIRNYSDVDLMVSLNNPKPESSDTAMSWIKSALTASFPYTSVRVSRPAVVVEFGSKTETWEIIPAFMTPRGGPGIYVYDIPGPAGGWIDTAPREHLEYVNRCNESGGAKNLARLAKAWKYYNNVPISSFYLEMRAAEYAQARPPFVAVYDIQGLLASLNSNGLAGMNDPSNASGRFEACSSQSKRVEALAKLSTAAVRSRKALDAHLLKNSNDAFYYLNLLFNDKFPSQYG